MSYAHIIHPNLAAFALGGLEPQEATELRSDLASCFSCREELLELQKRVSSRDAGSIEVAMMMVPGTQHRHPGKRLTGWSVI